MPLFEFRCDACGKRFERLLWRSPESQAAPIECACGSKSVERILYSRVAIGGSVGDGFDSAAAGDDAGGDAGDDFDCGSPDGCCGGACSMP